MCVYVLYTGVYELEVHTWRPSGGRVVDTLRRFFVGGAVGLSDLSYITRPSDFDVSAHQINPCMDSLTGYDTGREAI